MRSFGKRLDGPGGRRAARRESVLLSAALNSINASRSVTLLDVSRTGARMRCPEPLKLGQQIWLRVSPADIFGTIKWIDRDEYGILFDAELDDEDVADLEVRGRVVFCAGLSPDEQLGAED